MAKHYCRHCRESWNEGTHCPKCGTAEENYALLVIAVVFGVLLFLTIVLYLFLFIFLPDLTETYDTPKPVYEYAEIPTETQRHLEAQTRPSETEPVVPDGCWEDGLYEVGADIPAGEYVIMANGQLDSALGSTFHVSVFNTAALDDNDRAFGGWVQNNLIIRAEEGQFVELTHAVMYDADEPSRLDPFENAGMFCVGRDLPAGTYTLISTDDQYGGTCHYGPDFEEVLQRMSHPLYIPPHSAGTITLSEGDYIRMEFCRLDGGGGSGGGAFISYGDAGTGTS